MIKYDLNIAYRNRQHEEYLNILNNYLSEGGAVDLDIIAQYIRVCIELRQYDYAAKLLRKFEKQLIDCNLHNLLAKLWFYLYNLEEALKVLSSKDDLNSNDKYLLGRIYLRMGKISDSKNIFTEALADSNCSDKIRKGIEISMKEIINHEKYGSFVETVFENFKQNGNELEPGHIIFVKEIRGSAKPYSSDSKMDRRPYMIWKIENDNIYMFPVSTKGGTTYKLYKQKYRNSIGDRHLKDNLCVAKIEDVLSVQDKVDDYDFKIIVSALFNNVYFGNTKEEKDDINMKYFLTNHISQVNLYDVIKYVNPKTKECEFFFVLGIKGNTYKTVALNFLERKVIGNDIVMQRKDRIICSKFVLTKEERDSLLSQIPDRLKYDDLIGAKITYNGRELVIVEENENGYICVDPQYIETYMLFECIDHSASFTVDVFLEPEELDNINKKLSEYKKENRFSRSNPFIKKKYN